MLGVSIDLNVWNCFDSAFINPAFGFFLRLSCAVAEETVHTCCRYEIEVQGFFIIVAF